MNERTDQQLLRDYVQQRSEAAFTELVRRHVDFVYSAAVRMAGNPQSAEDVTQGVFVSLAQDAARLAEHPVLSGWLHCAARNLAANHIRANVRRAAREQEAAAMNDLLAGGSNALWDSLAPHLDAALGELAVADRDALLLRYFERKSAREMAQILGTSEEAAQKRVSRAVERLREIFSKRGIAIGGAGLVVAISANAVQAAPAGLAATVSTSAFVAGTAVQISTLTATKVILMTTAQKTLLGLALVTALAAPLVTHFHAQARLRRQDAALRSGAEMLAQLQADSTAPVVSGNSAAPQTDEKVHEVLRLRGEITGLQLEIQKLVNAKTNAPLTREEMLASLREYYSGRVQWLKGLFAANPSQQVPELRYLSDQKWLELVQFDHHAFDPDNSRLMGSARSGAQIEFAMQNLEPALQKFLKQNQGRFPTEISQLATYLPAPVDVSSLQDWTILPTSSFPAEMHVEGDWTITQRAPVSVHDSRFLFGAKGGHIENNNPKVWDLTNHQP